MVSQKRYLFKYLIAWRCPVECLGRAWSCLGIAKKSGNDKIFCKSLLINRIKPLNQYVSVQKNMTVIQSSAWAQKRIRIVILAFWLCNSFSNFIISVTNLSSLSAQNSVVSTVNCKKKQKKNRAESRPYKNVCNWKTPTSRPSQTVHEMEIHPSQWAKSPKKQSVGEYF